MEIAYLQQALDDIDYWQKTGNKVIQKKISQLIKSIEQTPFEGIGKPEALKYHHSGKWSRRITNEHRLIYKLKDEKILVLSMRGHYM